MTEPSESPAIQTSWLPRLLRWNSDSKARPPTEGDTNLAPPNEQTSLLPKPPSSADGTRFTSTGAHASDADFDEKPVSAWLRELAGLARGSIPIILAYTLQISLQTLSILIVGRISPEALATAAFSYMFATSTAWLIAMGGTTAIDTLASASFTGSSNKQDLGIILQRAFIVLGLLYIPAAILWFASEPVFLALGQEAYLARDAARFLSALVPGGLGYIYFECLKKFLQAQQIMRAGTYVLLITSPLNAALNYLFVYPLGMGLLGAPLATSISYWLSFGLLLLYARFVGGWECWGGWTRAALRNVPTFARLAFLGIVQVGTEWWAFEIVALIAGVLGTIPLAAQSVIMTTDQIVNTIPFGVGVATSARIGNLLGARDARGAARAANAAAWLSMILGVIVLVVLMGVKDFYAKLFNDDVRVVRLTAKVMPFVALFQIADGLNGSCGGVLRGMGRQHIGAAVNLLSYYAGALPLGIWLAFHGWGLEGLWIGQCIALYLVGFFEWGIVAFSNWDKQVDNAFSRMEEGERRASFLRAGIVDIEGVAGTEPI